MSIETAVTTLTCLMGAGTTILLAGIPWAYSVHGRLTKIETTLCDHLLSVEQITNIERRVMRMEVQQDQWEEEI